MPTINQHIRSMDLGAIIELYQLDTTIIGGTDILYFTPMVDGTTEIVFNAKAYSAVPCESSGWMVNTSNAPPRPKLKVANTQRHFFSYISALGDLVGAELTRIRTFENFLDGNIDADPTATLENQIYIVSKKTVHNKISVEWELIHTLERPGLRLPRRKILKDGGFPGAGTFPRI